MNNYHVYEKIGKGKHSTVYKGRKKKTINYYAIKSVDKSQKARVLQEVRTMHALDHKNVLRFYAWYETTNHLWLILEYCVGGDLVSLLRQDSKLPESSVHDFGRDLVVALQYLHSNSIIYCDLKPSNILLDENGRLKLGGFGLSRRLTDINKTPLSSLPPAKRGSPSYLAPELFSEGATHSTASDMWALGCVLYECATGQPPFHNNSFNQLVQDILNKDPAPLDGISAEFSDLLNRLLDKNPATRINWKELVYHPFWHVKLQPLPMPLEPALEAFITKYHLRPNDVDPTRSNAANDRAKSLRQSVDVMRLSRIALSNLEKEGDGSDYAAVEARQGDIRIENADAELDFEEQREDAIDEEEPQSPANQSDDGSVIDQGATSERMGVVSALTKDTVRAQAQARGRGGEPSSGGAPETAEMASTSGRPAAAEAALDMGDSDLADLVEGVAGFHLGDGASAVEALIWHPSDLAVKPIVANRRIERLPEPRYDPKALSFTPMSLQEMLSADQAALEGFLTHIYRAIASAAPLKDKVNVLSYFETLCSDTSAANVLINSSLTILFIRMLRTARAPTLRIRLASVLGLLVRHATYIAEELAHTGVVEILTEALKDKNERVRRRVMATLGELLFYVATQQQDAAAAAAQGGQAAGGVQEAAEAWQINSGTIAAVMRLLKPQEDEIAQHYAVKTIENICSQGGEWASKFSSQDVVFNLVQIFNTTKSENLKATTASTLARLLRHLPQLVAYMIDKFGVRLLVAGLSDGSSKVQTAAINMLNLALAQSDLSVRAKAALAEERGLVGALMGLLDHSVQMLRAKALVTTLLLCRLSTRWLIETCKAKLVPTVDRLQREKDPYVQAAVAALRSETARLVPTICQQINEELSRAGGGARKAAPLASPSSRSSTAQTRSPLQQFPVVLHLITSPFFRSAAVTPQLIIDLSSYVSASSGVASTTLAGMAEFKTALMHVLEALCQQTEMVLQYHQPMLEHLLPALCEVISQPSEGGDARFFCLRMVSEVTQLYLVDTELYGTPNGAAGEQRPGTAAPAIDSLLQRHILPMVPQLLREEDPMPLFALKLLGGLLEVNLVYVRDVESMGLASQFFQFLSLEHSNNNVHNIRLCRQVIAAGTLPVSTLQEWQVAEKVAAVLEYAAQNNVEPFLEPVLELCHVIVQRDAKEVKVGRSDGALMAALLDQAVTFLELCAHPEAHVCSAASLCVADLVAVFPAQCAPWLLSPESAAIMVSVLQGEHMDGAPAPPLLQQHLLEAIARSLAEPGALQQALSAAQQLEGAGQPGEELRQLQAAAKAIAATGDYSVKALAADVARMLVH